MASVRTFSLPHYDAYPVHVASFKDVTNAAFLRTQLLQGNPDFDYAFLDATMVSTIKFIRPLYSRLNPPNSALSRCISFAHASARPIPCTLLLFLLASFRYLQHSPAEFRSSMWTPC